MKRYMITAALVLVATATAMGTQDLQQTRARVAKMRATAIEAEKV